MMVDARLNQRNKLVLARLAMHLNLKTGRCDPPVRLLVLELSIGGKERNAIRAVRLSLERAEKLGWIKRHLRHGGDSRHNQSNLYTLTIPPDILAMLRPPIGQMDASDRAKRVPDRANTPSREGCAAPLIGKSLIGKSEYAVLSERPRLLTQHEALERLPIDLKQGVAEKGYSEAALSQVQHFLVNFNTGPRSFGAIRSFFKTTDDDITFGELSAMVRDGAITQTNLGYSFEGDDEEYS